MHFGIFYSVPLFLGPGGIRHSINQEPVDEFYPVHKNNDRNHQRPGPKRPKRKPEQFSGPPPNKGFSFSNPFKVFNFLRSTTPLRKSALKPSNWPKYASNMPKFYDLSYFNMTNLKIKKIVFPQ